MWNKIYDLHTIRENNIKFDEQIAIGEDVEFNAGYLRFCKQCVHIKKDLYYYNQRENSAMHRYNKDLLWYDLNAFYSRVPYIGEENWCEYSDKRLYTLIHDLKNVFDKRNPESFFAKMRYNQRMMRSEQFTFCIQHTSGQKESQIVMKLLKQQNYYLWWMFQKLIQIKNGIGKKENT